MTIKDLSDVAGLVESFVKTGAIILGGGWAYRKFVLQRESEPATDIDVDVAFVGRQDAKWVLQITATLVNKSLVRVRYDNFQVTARYILSGDLIEDGDERIAYQLRAVRTIDDRIGGAKRLFLNAVYINPKQEFRHRYITHLPIDATFVWVQCKFFFRLQGDMQKTNAQKIFRVPDSIVGPPLRICFE